MTTRIVSVACRSIPNKAGEGATGCGAGWTQPDTAPLACPKCGRDLFITGAYWLIPLVHNPVNKATNAATPTSTLGDNQLQTLAGRTPCTS